MHVKIYCLTAFGNMHMPEGIQFLSIPFRGSLPDYREAGRRIFYPPNAKKPYRIIPIRLSKKWRRPTLPLLRSTIGADRLNFSVRYGKRWNPVAITTWMSELNIVHFLLIIVSYRSILFFIVPNNKLSIVNHQYSMYNFDILFKNQNEINQSYSVKAFKVSFASSPLWGEWGGLAPFERFG